VVPVDGLEGLPGEDVQAGERETAMARQLVESLATDFDPTRFRDEYRDRVLQLIEQKAEGKAVVSAPQVKEPAGVVDLMAALEASLAEAKSRKSSSAKAETATSGAGRSGPAKSGPAKTDADDGAAAGDDADEEPVKRPRRRKAPSKS
jgi:DNA end-binding protein Ku